MKTWILVIALLLACVTGCKPATPTGSSIVTARANGRTVKATVRAMVCGAVFVQPQEDRFIVSLQGHQLVIEKERLLVDKKEAAKFPATATKFEVTYTDGALTVAADGTNVLTTTLGK